MADGEREEGKDRWRERERSGLSLVKREGEKERDHHTVKRGETIMHPKQRTTKTSLTKKREPQRPRKVNKITQDGLTVMPF